MTKTKRTDTKVMMRLVGGPLAPEKVGVVVHLPRLWTWPVYANKDVTCVGKVSKFLVYPNSGFVK